MKIKLPLLFALLFLCTVALAQNVVPNGNFETWISKTYFSPTYSFQTSNPPLFYANYDSFNCQKVTDAYTGSYAIKLTTVLTAQGDTAPGFFINGNAKNDPATWTGGIPISGIPTGASGYYKSSILPGDSGFIIFDFRSGGVSAGVYTHKFSGSQLDYTPFSFTFNPPISVTPDSVIFGASSSDIIDNKMIAGSILQLDDISFTGLVTQPAQLNGDFELWNSTTLTKPDSWLDQANNQFKGITQTTDAENGTYAIELKTMAGMRNNQPVALPAIVSNGYFECPGNISQCPLKGGSPYSGTTYDTLAFYYKYIPSADDTAEVRLSFKENGITIGGINPVQLLQSNNYQYMEIPFFVGQATDTAVVTFQSSIHGDSLPAYAGSDLKVDNVHFKTKVVTPSGVKDISAGKQLLIYPNPTSNGTFAINGIEPGEQLRIFNMLGEEINAQVTNNNGSSFTIQLPSNANGTYFVQVLSAGKVITGKITLNR